MHFINKAGADSVLNFSNNKLDYIFQKVSFNIGSITVSYVLQKQKDQTVYSDTAKNNAYNSDYTYSFKAKSPNELLYVFLGSYNDSNASTNGRYNVMKISSGTMEKMFESNIGTYSFVTIYKITNANDAIIRIPGNYYTIGSAYLELY